MTVNLAMIYHEFRLGYVPLGLKLPTLNGPLFPVVFSPAVGTRRVIVALVLKKLRP